MKWSFLIALLFPLLSYGQPGTSYVDARMDTSAIRIGEQIHLLLEVTYPSVVLVQWPAITDTLNKHIEVVADSGIDTARASGSLMRQVRSLTVTSFDSGFWAIPPFRFIVNGTPMETEPLLLEVRTVPLDSAMALRDIKDIHVLPFSVGYWIRQRAWWIGAAALALAVIATLLYLLLRKRKPAVQRSSPEVVIPLQERILSALGALDQQRLWQQGDHKGYHSRLTDLLRGYIEERYRVPALESTTDELLRELRVSPLNTDQRGQLENMLRLADMVKFAKALPSPQENEQMMAGALRFVQETAPRTTPPDHA